MSEVQKSGQDKVILYIDDNETNITLVNKIIDSVTSHTLISETDALKGLAIAEEQQPDLILMDLNMPGMNGYEALAELQANKAIQHIPVVAISGNDIDQEVKKTQSAGFNSYIAKPFRIKTMTDIFDEIFS